MKDNYSMIMVDDDPDDHFLFKEALGKINIRCQMTSVYNGLELIELLLKKESPDYSKPAYPDFIILDINMPVLNGFDTLEKIKSYKELNKIPVYIMSTSQNEEQVKQSTELGASGYYSKPNKLLKLQEIIAEILINL